MIIELQKFIDELKYKKAKASYKAAELFGDENEIGYGIEQGRSDAFTFCIQELTLLLNTEKASSGQNDSANSGNAM